jgi:two-component system nitrate/nitrite response regulator NarL
MGHWNTGVTLSVVNVTLVGSSRLHREWLRQVLDGSRFVVVAEHPDIRSVHALAKNGASPHLALVEFGRDADKDFEGLRQLRDAAPDWRIVVLSMELELSDLANVLRAGADGYLVSEISREALSLSLLLAMAGEKLLPGSLADILASDGGRLEGTMVPCDQGHLTERERLILQCLTKGYSNKIIARTLNITEGTVKVHLKSLMRKISAANRTQAALWAETHDIGNDVDAVGATWVPRALPSY